MAQLDHYLDTFMTWTAWSMEKPPAYGLFHLSFAFIGFALSLFFAWKLRNLSDKANRILLLCCGGFLVITEIYKQLFYYYYIGNHSYQWWIFPFQMCSIPMYLCIIAPMLKPGKVQKAMYDFMMIYNLLACILRSLGDGKTPLNAMIVASIINIVLDIVFVLVFRWGIAGAAIATVIAQVFSSLFCFWKLRQIKILRMNPSHFKWEGARALQLFRLGVPMAFQNAIIAIGGMLVQRVVNGLGVLYIAGFTATNKLYGILEIAATSYGYSMITYVGQNLGAKKIDRIRQGQRTAVILSVITSVIIGVIMLVFGKPILSMFISGTPEEVQETLRVAYFYLSIMSYCLPFLYLIHICRASIQGMGNTVLPMASGIAEFVMRVGTALFLPMLMGATGIFYAEILAWIGADIILIPSYYYVISKVDR